MPTPAISTRAITVIVIVDDRFDPPRTRILRAVSSGPRAFVDRRRVLKMSKLLKQYGHAEFTTDAGAYRPTLRKPAAA